MRSTLALGIVVVICLGGCGGDMAAGPSAAPATPAAAGATPTAPHAEPGDPSTRALTAEEAARELDRAERLTLALGPRAGGKEESKPKSTKGPVDKKNDEAGDHSNACQDACTALGSMSNASARLCDLAGGGDARCTQAKDRLKSAEDRVRASCPDCGAASK